MLVRAIVSGLRTAARHPGLVVLLWAWHTGLALVFAFPAWRWMRAVTAWSPETDALMDAVQPGTLIEVLQQHGQAVAPTMVAALTVVTALALVSNALVGGGLLAVVTNPAAGRPLLHRFFEGAGRFFGRFLGLLVVTAVAVLAVAGALAAAVSMLLRPLATSGWEPGAVLATLAVAAVAGLVLGLGVLVLDYARIAMVAGDARTVLPAWIGGAWFVVRHLPSTAAVGVVFGAAIGLALWIAAWVPSATGGRSPLVALVVACGVQLLMLLRIGLRVGQLASETEVSRLMSRPPAPAPPALPMSATDANAGPVLP